MVTDGSTTCAVVIFRVNLKSAVVIFRVNFKSLYQPRTPILVIAFLSFAHLQGRLPTERKIKVLNDLDDFTWSLK